MNPVVVNLLLCAAAVAVYFAAVMAASFRLHNHSIVDIFWGPGFVLVAAISYLASMHAGGDPVRRATVLVLTGVWGLRLGAYIGRRNAGHGQDARYTQLLSRRTGGIVGYVVRTVYGPQAVILYIVSLPVQIAMYERAPLSVLGIAGIAVWGVGFIFEAVGDAQLARFKSDPANAGQVMDRGLWAWTRHPNYFGDCCVWVGLWLLALGSPLGLLAVLSPLLMTATGDCSPTTSVADALPCNACSPKSTKAADAVNVTRYSALVSRENAGMTRNRFVRSQLCICVGRGDRSHI